MQAANSTPTPPLSRRTLLLASLAAILPARILLSQTMPASAPAAPAVRPHPFEKNVADYEAADKKNPPPQHAILLAGDSQFFRWSTLKDDLPHFTLINRGIDSLQMSDLLFFTDRLVLAYKPRMIVLHIGGNDVHNKRPPADILADYKSFVAKVRTAMPNIPIIFSSTTPGPARWDEAPARVQTNKLFQDYCATQKNMPFLDLWSAMLTPDGKPREDIWVADRIHPNHEGYLIRVKLMLPLLGPPRSEPVCASEAPEPLPTHTIHPAQAAEKSTNDKTQMTNQSQMHIY